MTKKHIKKIEALRDADPDIREEAALDLGDKGEETTVPALIETLRDKNSGVRIAVAEALSKIGAESSIPALIKALKDSNSIGQYDCFRKSSVCSQAR